MAVGIDKVHGVGKKVTEIAGWHKYVFLEYQQNTGMISFTRGDVRINIWLTKMTVGTCLYHPKQGNTQIFRRKVSFSELDQIFKNPRVHTGKGYQQKK